MGTKANPGKFDCYAAAGDDEPLFVLLARDPFAIGLVLIWSSLRIGEEQTARNQFEDLLRDMASRGSDDRQRDIDKAFEALDCAKTMFTWRAGAGA